MEEKKKRWRPSLTAYRELEEKIRLQGVELDELRARNRELEQSSDAVAYQKVVGERNQQIHYNSLKDNELAKLWKDNETLRGVVHELHDENYMLKHRSLWSRIFNIF